ncbi:MAG: hypothetical protein JOZ81_33085 [Chloroflexi bacterium]|nr:hypothetical protein [Chloroflexota bacterium]
MIAAVATSVLALASAVLVLADGASRARVAAGDTPPAAPGFAWLDPGAPPSGWRHTTTSASDATLFYPPGWRSIRGDRGTVTEALRDQAGLYVGYLNVTPREGAEQLHGWAAFRTHRNSEDGDGQVHQVAAAEGLSFRDARGSCVIDDYYSRVGSHRYREIACLITGRHHTDVFVGAALMREWPALSPTLERAASSIFQG